jgi:hypothetical protein
VWSCDACDSGHNLFDLPDTLDEALAEIFHLRKELQALFIKTKVQP